MQYKAILLDADGTLFNFDTGEENAVAGMLAHLRLEAPEAAAVYRRYNSECWAMLERGELKPGEVECRRFELFLRHYGRPDDVRAVSDFYLDLLSRQSILLEGALETVQTLARHAKLAVVTNGIPKVQHGRMDVSPIRTYLQALVISGEAGFAKPDPRLVWCALDALSVSAGEALLVGDSLTSDIRAANNAGVDACWLNPAHRPLPDDLKVKYQISAIGELPAALGLR